MSVSQNRSLVHRGNRNFNNNCFFNAMINLVSNLSMLRKELSSLSVSYPLLDLYVAYVNNDSESNFMKLYDFFMSMLQTKNINFKKGAQDDSHMCILFFFDCLNENEECKKVVSNLFSIKTVSMIVCPQCKTNKQRDVGLVQYTMYGFDTESSKISQKCEQCQSDLFLENKILGTSYYFMVFFNGTFHDRIAIGNVQYACVSIIWKSGSPNGGHYLMSVLFEGEWIVLDGNQKIKKVPNGFYPVILTYVYTTGYKP